jgi:hypothetical protein
MYLFYNILGLVPRTVFTTFKVLIVIFIDLGDEYSIIFGIPH